MMAASDEFHIVRRRRGKKSVGKVPNKTKISNFTSETDDDDGVFDLKTFQCRLNECIQELLLSEFFHTSYDAIITALSTLIESKTKQENKQSAAENEGSRGCYSAGNLTEDVPKSTSTLKDLNVSEECKRLTKAGNQSAELLCYGIGRFSTCAIARYQLAFLLVLKDKLGNPPCYIYDPLFTSHEKAALVELGCSLIDTNEEGLRVCHVPTIAFLPHCGKALYNNLIWANLSASGQRAVHNLLLIGNSFSSMIDRTPERQLVKTANYVKKIYPLMVETALPLFSGHSDVFNDLALHTFPFEKSESVAAEFWTNNPKPAYDEDEAELIMSTKKS